MILGVQKFSPFTLYFRVHPKNCAGNKQRRHQKYTPKINKKWIKNGGES